MASELYKQCSRFQLWRNSTEATLARREFNRRASQNSSSGLDLIKNKYIDNSYKIITKIRQDKSYAFITTAQTNKRCYLKSKSD